MTDKNPIYYSDLIKPDESIDNAIKSLTELKEIYIGLSASVKQHATTIQQELAKTTSSTDTGRKATSKAADEAGRLENAQRELAFAISETGAKVTELKMLTSQANKENKLSAEFVNSVSTSYNELKSQLGIMVTEYRKLSKEQALNSEEGKQQLQNILSLKSQLLEYDKLMKLNTKTVTESTTAKKVQKVALTDLEKAEQKLANATSAENIELLKLMAATKEATQVTKLNTIIATEAAGSYNSLSAQYSLNKIALNKMTLAEREQSVEGKKLVADTAAIYQQMIKLQEVTGKHTLSVGNYAKAWNGLDMGVSQVVRELPAAAISLNTFFLGISNNIPILMDEINKLRASNKAAAIEGKAQVSIMGSIAKSFLGFNTLLVIGLTIFSMYGKDILNWVGNLFKSKTAIDAAAEATKAYNDVMNEGRKDAEKDIVHLKLLYNATQDTAKSIDERTDAVNGLKEAFPKYFEDVKTETILAGDASDAYLLLASSIIKSAMARAAENKIVENSQKILDLQAEKAENLIKQQKYLDNLIKFGKPDAFGTQMAGDITLGFGNKQKAIDQNDKDIAKLQEQNQKLAEGINVTDLTFTTTDEKDTKKKKDPKEAKDETLELMRARTDSEIALIRDENVRKREETSAQYNREITDLQFKLATDEHLTELGKEAINGTIINKQQILNDELEKLDKEAYDKELELRDDLLKAEQDAINNKLDIVKEGSFEENMLRLELLEKTKQEELVANARLTEELRLNEKDIIDKYNALMMQQNNDYLLKSGLEELEIKQAANKAEFELIARSEHEKTVFKLTQEKERWQKLLDLALIGAKDLSETELETIRNIIKGIDREINEGSGKKKDKMSIYDMLGINLTDNQQDALKQAADATMASLNEIMQAQIDLANIAVESANKRVEAAQTAMEGEIEARKNGYASNVSQAQKDLDLARKTQDKALKDQEKAQKAQNAINTITQTGSLITASANIWASLSVIPVIGVGLALAALGIMWGSFAVAKVKAAQVTKAQSQSQSYGEGGLEILTGGSHASGNDVPIGVTPDGKQRKAEGGEALAIINKSKTKKYRSMLPDIVDSLNKGIFEEKYLGSYNTDGFGININGSHADLSKLENSVDDIKLQGERKYFVDGKGNMIEIYKNLKRIYNAN